MKWSTVFLVLLLARINVFSQEMVTIKGTIHGDTKGYNKVYVFQPDQGFDSTVIAHQQFEFTLPYKPGMMPILVTEYDQKVSNQPYLYVPIEQPGVLILNNIDIAKSLHSGTWSGMQAAQDYQEIAQQLHLIEEELKSKLQAKYGMGKDDDSAHQQEEDSLWLAARIAFYEVFVKAHPASYGLMAFLNQVRVVTHVPLADQEKIYNMFSASVRNSFPGKDLGAFLLGLKNAVTGNAVKDFTLYTPSHQLLKFSSLRGKYVLVDFWASWCGPCRQSIPHLKEIYQQYKGHKFEIYSISIDANKKEWLKAIEKENMPWLQALDTINVSASRFGVQGLPTALLIDPEGKILVKESGFDPQNSQIEKKLAALFK